MDSGMSGADFIGQHAPKGNGTGGGTAAPQAKPIVPPIQRGASFVNGFVAPEYAVDGLIMKERFYSLTAQTGHGKTAVALCIAIAKAMGRDVAGRRTDAGRVLYLAAENPDDIKMRLILMADRLALPMDTLELYVIEGGFDLEKGFDELMEQVKSVGELDMIFADTGAAFLAASGATEENDNMSALRFAYACRDLTKLPGNPAVVALMHPIKAASKDTLTPRGGGSFVNETDGNLVLWAEGERETTELHWQGKFRGPSFDPIVFALESGTCSTLVDKAGRLMPSVWAYVTSAARAEQAENRHRGEEDDVLLVMLQAPGASCSKMAELLGWRLNNGEPNKMRVQRTVERLKGAKLAKMDRGHWDLTAKGKKEAETLKGQAR